MLTDICGKTAVAVKGGGGGLWLSIYFGSNLEGWAIAMGAGLVMVVTVAAGIINVDMANIAAAAADGKTEIFGFERRRARNDDYELKLNFYLYFVSIHRRFADMIDHQNGRRRCIVTWCVQTVRSKSFIRRRWRLRNRLQMKLYSFWYDSGIDDNGDGDGDDGSDDNERLRSRRQDDCVRTDATAVSAKQPLNDRAARHRGGRQRRWVLHRHVTLPPQPAPPRPLPPSTVAPSTPNTLPS